MVGGQRPPQKTRPAILVVTLLFEDRVLLSQMLDGLRLDVHVACNVRESLDRISRQPVAVVVSDDVLPDGDWKNILDGLTQSLAKTKLIVSSRLAGEALWAQVLNLGGYDVLANPFDIEEVHRVVGLACDHG
jgi:DNA-binding NtrC family response regulator